MSFHLTDLLTLIVRVHDRHKIPMRKLMRVTLQAAAQRKFSLWKSDGSRLKLSGEEREWLLCLATKAEQQTEIRFWTKPPWSALRSVLVNEPKFWNWVNHALRTAEQNNAVVVAAPSICIVVVQLLKEGKQPGSTILWKAFCDDVRDRCEGWKDRKHRVPKRGFGEKTIKRIVKKAVGQIGQSGHLG